MQFPRAVALLFCLASLLPFSHRTVSAQILSVCTEEELAFALERGGDTVTETQRQTAEAYPGFKPLKPMVFAGLYPVESHQYSELREALDKPLAYDHVVGADITNRPGWPGPYTFRHQFHEPLTLFGFLAEQSARTREGEHSKTLASKGSIPSTGCRSPRIRTACRQSPVSARGRRSWCWPTSPSPSTSSMCFAAAWTCPRTWTTSWR